MCECKLIADSGRLAGTARIRNGNCVALTMEGLKPASFAPMLLDELRQEILKVLTMCPELMLPDMQCVVEYQCRAWLAGHGFRAESIVVTKKQTGENMGVIVDDYPRTESNAAGVESNAAGVAGKSERNGVTDAPVVKDMVNAPKHYCPNGVDSFMEYKDVVGAEPFHGFLQLNVLKYIQRYKFKGVPAQDLNKAFFYLAHLFFEMGGEKAALEKTLKHVAGHYGK